MRILFDEQIYSNQTFGGVSLYFSELVRELNANSKISARILSPLCTNQYGRNLPYTNRIGIPFPDFQFTSKFVRYFNRRCASRLINFYRPHILHETYYPNTNRRPPPGTKVVTTVYDMIHELYRRDFPPIDRTSEFKKKAVDRVDHIICISENTRKDLIEQFGVQKTKTTVVHLGADHFAYRPLPPVRESGSPYLLYVGLRGAYKNFAGAIKAYANNSYLRKHFDFVCFGGGVLKNGEVDLVRQLKIPRNKCVWMGGDDTVLCSLYQHAAAFVYPSLYEGFGIPPLEAMIQRCPVVSSNAASLPNVLGKAAEYFNPHQLDEMENAIISVVSSPSRCSELRAIGVERASKYTWKSCAEATLATYQTLK
jgi:glycosyltransferase involved in cell wall biosynthesis